MAKIIEKLQQDHKNILKLLSLLEKQLKHFAAGEYADYQITTDIMQYFVNYPDVHHHPQEDIVFTALKKKNITVADVIDEIYSEHQTMASESATILDEMIQIQGNVIFSRAEIVNRLKDFISNYNSHIDKEEELFTLAANILEDEDWRRIDAEMEIIDDPLFGKILDNEYQELYKVILSEDKGA